MYYGEEKTLVEVLTKLLLDNGCTVNDKAVRYLAKWVSADRERVAYQFKYRFDRTIEDIKSDRMLWDKESGNEDKL